MGIRQRIAGLVDRIANSIDNPVRDLYFSRYLCRQCGRHVHWWYEDRHEGWSACMTDEEFAAAGGIIDHKEGP